MEELRVRLCHFLGHHLLLRWSTKAQQVFQLLLLALLVLLLELRLLLAETMTLAVRPLMLMAVAGVYAGAIADRSLILHDTTAIWQ